MKEDDKWRTELDELSYKVCRLGHTEPAFSGKYVHHNEDGTYRCICCGASLFDSDAKFDSNCGWPSFDRSKNDRVKYLPDTSHGMLRTEIRCANCDSHLGHVFDDGPTQTRKRYCVNSASLDFVQEND